ncbi:hypothetical protein VTK56DRAFT_8828 [Thermocarpiscus australiensis]
MASTNDSEQSFHLDKKTLRVRATSLAFIQSRLHRLSGSPSERSVQSASDIKGPLGLTLLHEPSEPRIDFIFVHGLFGGSRRTWSYSSEPGMFWPKEWLPNEVGFRHVRLHSYGYNSDWTTRKESYLTIHDFGQALIADVYNSPSLRKNGDTPIIFVAHSMGGLVVKKAYLLATHDPTYMAIARRIHTMFFLGTPHRGSDSAQIARIVRYSAGYGVKAFVDDLVPGSAALDQINDEFRHVCSNVRLWSYFEGVPTSFGLISSLVVEKESAILGLPGEHVQYMDADHRHLCKFESPISQNYVTLQRAFLTTIAELEADSSFQRRDEYRAQMKLVSSFLRIDHKPDAILLAINEKQHHGSCQWLTTDETFQEWVNCSAGWENLDQLRTMQKNENVRILWLKGRPGTGKSVASAHVIRYLEACNLDCSFYFYRHNDREGSTVSALLQSLAFQMAESSYEVRRAIVSMAEDDIRINHGDHHMLWSKLFVDRIFCLESLKPQFWVIDAVDECSSNGMSVFVSMLSKLDRHIPLRVFMTSRPGGQLERLLTQEKLQFMELSTGQAGSLSDIERFLQAKFPRIADDKSYQRFVADVLSKSNGIFLWASLIVSRLENTYSVEDMLETLQTIPSEMDGFYSRITESILASPSCDLAKCILRWAICSPKPLSTSELAEAVKLDIDRTLTASPSQLETITGHLIFVDSQSRVHVTHQTMSTFLTQRRDGLWIDRSAAHARITEVCLTILCGSEFAPPRTRRGAGAVRKVTGPLAAYAAANFAYHLMHSSAAVDTLLIQLNKFLRSNVLTWIEREAESGDLSVLQRTTNRLKSYLARRAKYQPPVSVEVRTVAAWAGDIYHIVAAFHSCLLDSPHSIHFLIPHLCPPASIIHQLFTKPTKRLRITGPVDEDWSDRLTCYLFSGDACSIACCERLLAVGLRNGDIVLYDSAGFGTFGSVGTVVHGKKVRQLAFNATSSILASCSVRKLMLWDVRRSNGSSFPCLWALDLDFTPDHMLFDNHGSFVMLSDPQRSAILTFRATDGSRGDPHLLHAPPDSDSSDSGQQSGSWTPAEQVRLDAGQKLAAVAYRSSMVSIWDLEAVDKIGNFEREGYEDVHSSPPVRDMIFNPIPDLELLAISYKDGDLVICSPWTLEQVGQYRLSHSLDVLASTSDGRVLAGGAEDGAIHLFLFETLQPLHRIQPPDEQFLISGLTFSADNLRFFDIRGQCCNVWEPSVLVPRDRSDDSSSEPQSEEVTTSETTSSRTHTFRWAERITTICPTEGSMFFVGRQDGTIDVFDTSTGSSVKKLRLHARSARVEHISWCEGKSFLLSVDAHNRCIVTRVSLSKNGSEPDATSLLDHRERSIVRQAILSPDGASVLVRTSSNVKLIAVNGGSVIAELDSPPSSWTGHPSDPSALISFQNEHMHLFDWCSLRRLTDTGGILIAGCETSTPSQGIWVTRPGSSYLARCLETVGSPGRQTAGFVAFEAPKVAPATEKVEAHLRNFDRHGVKTVIGVLKSTLYFLDMTGWLCSVSLRNLRHATHYTRHLFVPPTWHTGGDLVIEVLSKTAVAFARGEQLIVFHGFLEFEEKVPLEVDTALALRPGRA